MTPEEARQLFDKLKDHHIELDVEWRRSLRQDDDVELCRHKYGMRNGFQYAMSMVTDYFNEYFDQNPTQFNADKDFTD